MQNDLKNRKRICTSLSIDIIEKLKNYSTDTGIPISKILDMAIVDYLDKAPKPLKK